jgi:hypothetical protein
MTNKKPPFSVVFDEGVFDELAEDSDLTQEELDAFVAGIFELAESGEIVDYSTPVEELPEEEQAEIIDMLKHKQKKTRH